MHALYSVITWTFQGITMFTRLVFHITILGSALLSQICMAAAPEYTWLNQFAGFPERVIQNAAPYANGLVGAAGSRSIPMKFRASDGSIECHVLIRYQNGKWETTGDVGLASAPDNCGTISSSFGARVHDVAPFNDSICIGGDFYDLGPTNLRNFACYTSAGSWLQIGGPGNGPNNTVNVLANAGTLMYLGGSFTEVKDSVGNPISARRVVRTDGILWEPLATDNAGTSEGVSGTVSAILPATSHVYLGIGTGVTRWTSGANDKFKPLGNSNTTTVRDLELNGSQLAAVSSGATTWGGLSAGAISEFDDGTLEWSAVGSSSGINTGFSALTVAGGYLYATGDFTAIDPAARGIARLHVLNEWEPSTDAAALGDFPGFLDLLQMNGEICGLQQGASTGQTFFSRGIACNDGQKWYGLAQGIQGEVRDIIKYNGAVIAGGKITAAGDQNLKYIAEYRDGKWSALGGGLEFTGANPSNPGHVSAMAIYQGDLYVMGLFNEADGNSTPGLARWDGQNWHAVGPGIQSPGDIMLVWNNQLIIYGFAPSGDGPILSWNGTTLSEFDDLPSFQQPTAMAIYNGELIAAYGQGALVRWSGAAWETLTDQSLQFNGPINAMITRDNDLFVGGSFGAFSSGQPFAEQVVMWNGNSWSAMGDGLQSSLFGVEEMIFAGAGIIAIGWFDSSGGTQLDKLGYFDGQDWYALGPGLYKEFTGSSGHALMIDGSTVYVGGSFEQAGNTWADSIGAFTLKLQTIFESGFEASQ